MKAGQESGADRSLKNSDPKEHGQGHGTEQESVRGYKEEKKE